MEEVEEEKEGKANLYNDKNCGLVLESKKKETLGFLLSAICEQTLNRYSFL